MQAVTVLSSSFADHAGSNLATSIVLGGIFGGQIEEH
jgi:hypothetical protein